MNMQKLNDEIARLEEQETQPLPRLPFECALQETSEERFRRLKAFSDATGIRLLFVYLVEQRYGRQVSGHGYWQTQQLSTVSN